MSRWVLLAIVALALALRLWNIDHGLPFAYNADEAEHFVPKALAIAGGASLDPGYYENPSGLTYLLALAYALIGDADAFLNARIIVAVIGTGVVALTYLAGARFYDSTVGLVAAALMAVSFLPFFYSKHALNDVVTLAPVTVALIACLAVYRSGSLVAWAIAGSAIGVATATKYTAGAMLVCLALAALVRVTRERRALAGILLAGVGFLVAFAILSPYTLLELSEARRQITGQSRQAANAKLGQDEIRGWFYYIGTLTWGFGWLPIAGAIAGGLLALWRDWRRALLLIAFPVCFYLYLGAQGRFFGRWLMPIYPMLCILAGYAVTALAAAVAARLRAGVRAAALATALIAAVASAQGLWSVVRSDLVLGRTDTRQQALDWVAANVPAGAPMVVEPFVPTTWLERLERPRWKVERPFQAYQKRLRVARIAEYRRGGFCWVIVGSTQKERGLKAGLKSSRRYYRALDQASEQTVIFSPFKDGERVPFSYDSSFNYRPSAFERPGPTVEIHRLADCR